MQAAGRAAQRHLAPPRSHFLFIVTNNMTSVAEDANSWAGQGKAQLLRFLEKHPPRARAGACRKRLEGRGLEEKSWRGAGGSRSGEGKWARPGQVSEKGRALGNQERRAAREGRRTQAVPCIAGSRLSLVFLSPHPLLSPSMSSSPGRRRQTGCRFHHFPSSRELGTQCSPTLCGELAGELGPELSACPSLHSPPRQPPLLFPASALTPGSAGTAP